MDKRVEPPQGGTPSSLWLSSHRVGRADKVIENKTANDRYWHLADIRGVVIHVRFRGNDGH